MGGNQVIILTRIDLYKLPKSILGKLNNWTNTLWNNATLKHNLYKNILLKFIQIHEWLPPYDSCLKLAAEVQEKDSNKPNEVWYG